MERDLKRAVKEGLEKYRDRIKEGHKDTETPVLDPLQIKNFLVPIEQHIVQLKLTLDEGQVHNLSKFEVQRIDLSPDPASLTVKIRYEELKANGTYQINGKIIKILKVSGKGDFNVKAANVEATCNTTFSYSNKILQAETMSLSINWGTVDFHFTNLTIVGLKNKGTDYVFRKIAKNIINKSRPGLQKHLAGELQKSMNKELKNPSMESVKKIYEILKQHEVKND